MLLGSSDVGDEGASSATAARASRTRRPPPPPPLRNQLTPKKSRSCEAITNTAAQANAFCQGRLMVQSMTSDSVRLPPGPLPVTARPRRSPGWVLVLLLLLLLLGHATLRCAWPGVLLLRRGATLWCRQCWHVGASGVRGAAGCTHRLCTGAACLQARPGCCEPTAARSDTIASGGDWGGFFSLQTIDPSSLCADRGGEAKSRRAASRWTVSACHLVLLEVPNRLVFPEISPSRPTTLLETLASQNQSQKPACGLSRSPWAP